MISEIYSGTSVLWEFIEFVKILLTYICNIENY
jgi:hypothetical protein